MSSLDNKQKKIRARGTGCFDLSDNSFGFTAFNEGPSSQTNVKSCKGGGKSWETTGSDPSRMITLKTKMSSPDQYADFLRQFNALTKDLKPKKPVQMPESMRMVAEDGLQCWLDTEKGKMTFTGKVDLSCHCRDWQAEVLRLVQLVVRRLPSNENFNRVIKNIKNGGNK